MRDHGLRAIARQPCLVASRTRRDVKNVAAAVGYKVDSTFDDFGRDIRLYGWLASDRSKRKESGTDNQGKTSHRPNENKMSDGGRERASMAVEVWKSSQMWTHSGPPFAPSPG